MLLNVVPAACWSWRRTSTSGEKVIKSKGITMEGNNSGERRRLVFDTTTFSASNFRKTIAIPAFRLAGAI